MILSALPVAPAFWAAAEHHSVRYVVDGDTLDVSHVGRVRLLGIDAPEVGIGLDTPAPFAPEAKALLATLVGGRYASLEADGDRYDKYGRRLAYLLRDDGLLVNAEMLRAGLARVSARRQLRRLGELRAAERSAKVARKGMWGERPVLPLERPVGLRSIRPWTGARLSSPRPLTSCVSSLLWPPVLCLLTAAASTLGR